VAAIGLALLAFLEHGESPAKGAHQAEVRRGLEWLKGQQGGDGCLGAKAYPKHLYNHAIGTLALCRAVEAGEAPLKPAAQGAVDYLLVCRNPGLGWRYANYNVAGAPPEESGNNDTSVTAWAVMALSSARAGGLKVPEEAFRGADAFMDQVLAAGTFGYTRPRAFVHKSPYTTTALGIVIRKLAARNLHVPAPAKVPESTPEELRRLATDLGDPKYEVREAASARLDQAGKAAQGVLEEASRSEDLEVKARAEALLEKFQDKIVPGVPILQQRLPDWKSANFYYWYGGALALSMTGGEPWDAWKDRLRQVLVRNQEVQGCARGSWDPAQDTWGSEGGRVYTTALGALCLRICGKP
jgi:hypothetical protein